MAGKSGNHFDIYIGGSEMRMKAIWNDRVIAESDETVVFEGNHYFPSDAIMSEFFKSSNQKSTCNWKGTASYYDIIDENKRNPAAAWYYPEPSAAAGQTRDHIAFWRGVKIVRSDEV
jgi:uncharacterized protein (DUF427 family)